MRSLAIIVLALLMLVAATPAGATTRPGLRIVNTGGGLAVAGRRGRFTARFRLLFGGCGPGYVISARGSLGSRARLKLAPPPCPPPVEA